MVYEGIENMVYDGYNVIFRLLYELCHISLMKGFVMEFMRYEILLL